MKPLKIRFQKNVTRSVSQSRHLSTAHDKIQHNHSKAVSEDLEKAVDYCKTNNCRGYAALATGYFQHIKDPRTINKRLDSSINTIMGLGKPHLRVLTFEEESSFVDYLLNKNR